VLQANGVASYENAPDRNLGVGERAEYLGFSDFAQFHGTVLDIGCGPQSWPTHFNRHAPGTRFVGVDPLVGGSSAEYTQVCGLAEALPFRDGAFHQTVFATSLDHLVDPAQALSEAGRVVRPGGTVEIFMGEKHPDAPRPAASPSWYQKLERPPGAYDVFHIKRFTVDDAEALFDEGGFQMIAHERVSVDEFRALHFFKLAPPS